MNNICRQTCSNRCANRCASGSRARGARAGDRGCNTHARVFQQYNATPDEIVSYFAKHPYNGTQINKL